MSDNCRLVEGDGIVTNMFYFLWKKKTDTGSLQTPIPTSGDGSVPLPWERDGVGKGVKFTPEFSVPSTVMFEHNYPKAWYYPHPTGKASWDFERKLGKDIDSLSILKNFCPRSAAALEQYRAEEASPSDASPTSGGGGGVSASLLGGSSAGTLPPHLQKFEERDFVAAYFSTVKSGTTTTSTATTPLAPTPPTNRPQTAAAAGRSKSHHEAQASEEPLTVVEYLNEPQLRDFLLRRTKREDGFLQRWVWPNGKHNNVIQAIWTPHMCLVSRRTNQHAVRDGRESMYDRAVTFEGPSYLSGDSYVAPHVQWQVERFCADLVAYMFAEHHIPLRRMVLHFKVDWNSTVWFLWASSIRVQDKSQINLTVPYTARKELDAMRRQQSLAASVANQQQLRQQHSARSLSAVSTVVDFSKTMVELPPDAVDRGQHDVGRERFLSHQPPEARKLIHMVEAERHLTAIAFPKAPSMGAIGGVYTWGSLTKPLSKPTKPKKRRIAVPRAGGSDSTTNPNSATPTTRGSGMTIASRHNSLGGFPAPTPPTSHQVEPRRKKKKSKRRGNSPMKNVLSPRFDDVLKSLQAERTSAFDSAMRHRDEREHHAALRLALDEHAKVLFGPARAPRSGRQLWTFVRHLVLTGFVRAHCALNDASELLSLIDYSVYSHFLSSEESLTFQIPASLANGVPTREADSGTQWVAFAELLRSVGLVVTEGFDEEATIAQPPAAPKQPYSAGHRRKSTMARQLPESKTGSMTELVSPTTSLSPTRGDVANASMASDGLPPPSSGAFLSNNSLTKSQTEPLAAAALDSDGPRRRSLAQQALVSSDSAPSKPPLSPGIKPGAASSRNTSFANRQMDDTPVEDVSKHAPTDWTATALPQRRTLTSVTIRSTKKPIADVTASIKHNLLRQWVVPLLAASTWYVVGWQWVLYRRAPQDGDDVDATDDGGDESAAEGSHAQRAISDEEEMDSGPAAGAPADELVAVLESSTTATQKPSSAPHTAFSLLAVVEALSGSS